MTYIRMSFAEVEQLATSLSGSAQRNLDEVNALASKAQPDAVWEGSAARSYGTAFERWHKAQVEAQSALTALSDAVNKVRANYQQIEKDGSQAFDGFYA